MATVTLTAISCQITLLEHKLGREAVDGGLPLEGVFYDI